MDRNHELAEFLGRIQKVIHNVKGRLLTDHANMHMYMEHTLTDSARDS